MSNDDWRVKIIYETYLLLASIFFMAIGFIGLTLLALKSKWIYSILEWLHA